MRILITGKNSYIAGCFIDYVKRVHPEAGFEIEAVSVRDNPGKITDMDFSGYDVILHTAAVVHQKEQKTGEESYIRVNYELPVALAERAAECGVSQFVFLSTMAVYGDMRSSHDGRITEHTPVNPVTYYGKYKALAEKELLKISSDAFKVAVIRPPMVYGKNCKGNYNPLKKLSAFCFLFPSLNNKRSMIYIENLCEYLCVIIKRGLAGIGHPQNAEAVSTAVMVKEMRAVNGQKTRLVGWVNPLIRFLVGKISVFNKLFGNCYYDIAKKEGYICIPPTEYEAAGFKESIKRS